MEMVLNTKEYKDKASVSKGFCISFAPERGAFHVLSTNPIIYCFISTLPPSEIKKKCYLGLGCAS